VSWVVVVGAQHHLKMLPSGSPPVRGFVMEWISVNIEAQTV
jgi:hypothetical protein